MIYTAESVTAWHPDKICDQMSDAILDACLEQDPMSRVAVETIGGHGILILVGEVTTKAEINYSKIVKKAYAQLTGKDIGVLTNIVAQSQEIAHGVNKGGAGDQGIMIGYACNENDNYLPNELEFAKRLLRQFDCDGKSQVTYSDNLISKVILSVQGKTQENLKEYVADSLRGYGISDDLEVFCNNAGSFETGGFDADSGCTGRKIVVDAYGPRIPVGGGAFSGKDPTKVDRSAAYMARWIALKLLKEKSASEVLVKIAYAIGGLQPVMQCAIIDGKYEKINFDCRPMSIINQFNLRRPIYLATARYGHFGFKQNPWEVV